MTALPRELSAEEFALFAAAGERLVATPGERLFQRGDTGQQMFLVERGGIRLDFEDGLAQRVLGPGECCGELALFVGQHARMASAVVDSEAVLYAVGPRAFEALFEQAPVLMARFMRRCFSYLIASEGHLIAGLRRRNEDLLQTLESLRQTRSELSLAQQLVRTDELTGLSNRRGLYRFLEEFRARPVPGMRHALLLIDVDDFKLINDTAGHLAGDGALRAVAEEVRHAAGPLELPCRLGGDEFALVANSADVGDLANRAIQLVGAVRSLRLPSLGDSDGLSVSVGASFFVEDEPWSATYSRADRALYQAKLGGGNGWRLAGD